MDYGWAEIESKHHLIGMYNKDTVRAEEKLIQFIKDYIEKH